MELDMESDAATAVSRAARDYDLTSNAAWRSVQKLSDGAEATGFKIDPSNVSFSNEGFSAVGSAYVRLRFEGDGETFWEGFSFPAHASGRIGRDGNVVFERLRIDTDGFFK